MAIKPNLLMLGAVLCISASTPARAQTVYKCGSRVSVTYFQAPCSNGIVNTDEAPPARTPKEAARRRLEHQRIMARSMRPRPGETAQQFEARRRARLMDGAECERLETRMPVEAETALSTSKKRFRELRCR